MIPLGKQVKQLKGEKQFFEWTPKLSCQTASEAPTVEYTHQIGNGCKIKISENLSIVFVQVYLIGKITAVSSGNNYATISGLPYKQSLNGGVGSFNFSMFYKGIADDNPMPIGNFAIKTIRIQSGKNSHRGGSVERWVASTTNFNISGSGFYFTDE